MSMNGYNWDRARRERQAAKPETILPAEPERTQPKTPRNITRKPLKVPPMRRIKDS